MGTPSLGYTEVWEAALCKLLVAAKDTAEFETGEAIGRSRSASIRRLAETVRELEHLELAGRAVADKFQRLTLGQSAKHENR